MRERDRKKREGNGGREIKKAGSVGTGKRMIEGGLRERERTIERGMREIQRKRERDRVRQIQWRERGFRGGCKTGNKIDFTLVNKQKEKREWSGIQ